MPPTLSSLPSYRARHEQSTVHIPTGVGCLLVCITLRVFSMPPNPGRPKPYQPMNGKLHVTLQTLETKLDFWVNTRCTIPGTGDYRYSTPWVGTPGERDIFLLPGPRITMPSYDKCVETPRVHAAYRRQTYHWQRETAFLEKTPPLLSHRPSPSPRDFLSPRLGHRVEMSNNRRPLLRGRRRRGFQHHGQAFLDSRGKFRTALAELDALLLHVAGGDT